MTAPKPVVVPIASPTRAQLWLRQQIALAVLSHRGCTAEAAGVVARVLQGDLSGQLVEFRNADTPDGNETLRAAPESVR